MKKHNEGYALALVLVVLVVICLVAVSILSASLSNLKSQQASIARMQAQYKAQGKIEQVVAKLEKEVQAVYTTTKCEYAFSSDILKNLCVVNEQLIVEKYKIDNVNQDSLTFSLTVVDNGNTIKIDCDIQISGAVVQDNVTGNYTITNPVISYVSYEITTTESAEGGVTE